MDNDLATDASIVDVSDNVNIQLDTATALVASNSESFQSEIPIGTIYTF